METKIGGVDLKGNVMWMEENLRKLGWSKADLELGMRKEWGRKRGLHDCHITSMLSANMRKKSAKVRRQVFSHLKRLRRKMVICFQEIPRWRPIDSHGFH